MEFWGVEVKPGEKVRCEPGVEKFLHLSQACLGERKNKGNVSVPVYVHFEGKKLVIGTLNHDNCAQVSYDLVFEKEFQLSHSWKDGSVFFTGYKTIIGDEEEIDSTESEEEEEEEELVPQPVVPKVNGKPAKKENAAPKPSESAPKAKGKPENAVKPPVEDDEGDESDESDEEGESDESDEEGESDGESDEEMVDGDDSEDDEEESSEEEEKVTPKKDKKRPAVDAKTPSTDNNKKAKVVTPAGKTGGADAKKVPHAATPYPKQAGKTPATGDKSKQQTPKSGGGIVCKSCSKSFGTDTALQSHTKAKHSS